MTARTKLYLAAAIAAVVLAAAISTSIRSAYTARKLERELTAAKAAAANKESGAREMEQRAAEYKQKIEYLEDSLSALRLIADKQDEEIKLIEKHNGNARRDLDAARRVQRIESTAAELCRKLAALGHPCE